MNHQPHRSTLRAATLAILASAAIALVAGCTKTPRPQPTFADLVARAHNKTSWDEKSALTCDFVIAFDKQPPMEGKLYYDLRSTKSRIELNNGTRLVYDANNAYVTPASSTFENARFHLLTWPFFIAAPFKLHDPGATLSPAPDAPGPSDLQAEKLTFAPGTGDSPADWYLVYKERGNHRLRQLAYVVTYGRDIAEAQKEPHAITYYDIRQIDGVNLALEWKLWKWHPAQGIFGPPIGGVRLSNVEFTRTKPAWFERPADSRIDPKK